MFTSNSRKIFDEDLREELKVLALRHSQFYRRLSKEPKVERLSSCEDTLRRTAATDVNVTAGRDALSIVGTRLRGKHITCCSSGDIRSLVDKSFQPIGGGEERSRGETIESSPGRLNELRRRSEEPLVAAAFGSDARWTRTGSGMYEDLFKGTLCDNREDDRQQPLGCGDCSREVGRLKMSPLSQHEHEQQQHSRLCCFLGKGSGDAVAAAGMLDNKRCVDEVDNNNDVDIVLRNDVGIDRFDGHRREMHKYKDIGGHNTIRNNSGPTTVVVASDVVASTVDVAINNKNKTTDGEEWDRSNYLTSVPATSLARRFDCATQLARCCSNRSGNSITDKSVSTGERYIFLGEEGQQRRQTVERCCSSFNSSSNFRSLVQQRKKELFEYTFSKDYDSTSAEVLNTAVNDDEPQEDIEKFTFPCVENLVKMYTKLLEEKKAETVAKGGATKLDVGDDGKLLVNSGEKVTDLNRSSPISDEGCPTGQSPYSSDNDEMTNEENESKEKEKVIRSSSSDSALGLEDDVSGGERSSSPTDSPPTHNTGRRMTLTVTDIPLRPALLPLAEPTHLPDTSLQQSAATTVDALLTQTAIPSKVLLEERVVEIPEDKYGGSLSNSRRESAQSCVSDFNSEYGVRYVRTPSVVVSDYSDDVMCGITLEEIEYFRQYRMRRRSSGDTAATEKDETASDVSAASSCSNLYYCGSTISALDGADCYVNGIRTSIDRKISDCSTCSTVSGDEDDDSFIIHDFQVKEQQQQQQLQEQSTRKTKKH